MGEKKKPGRFTLQFNLEDPQQRTVSELLEQQGRRKAQFLTSAVLRYIQCPEPPEYSGNLPVIEEAALERMLLSMIKKHPQLMSAPQNAPPEPTDTLPPTASASETWGDPMGDDAMKAISDTLAAFRQE